MLCVIPLSLSLCFMLYLFFVVGGYTCRPYCVYCYPERAKLNETLNTYTCDSFHAKMVALYRATFRLCSVTLLILPISVYSAETWESLIRHYFYCEFSYPLIICFLYFVHGISLFTETIEKDIEATEITEASVLKQEVWPLLLPLSLGRFNDNCLQPKT